MFEEFTSTKELSKTTQKIYLGALNRLAVMEIDTKQKLIDDQKFVAEVLESIFDEDTESERHTRRIYLCAIFWVLHDEPLAKKKAYYDLYQKSLPKTFKSKDKDTQGNWVSKKKFMRKKKKDDK